MKFISEKGFNFFCNNNYLFFIDRDKQHKDKFYKTDLDKLFEITQDEYAENKFSNCWLTLQSPYTECIKLDSGEFLTCIFHDSFIFRHDQDGNKIKEYNIGRFDTGFDTIYSIALDKNGFLWIAQPSSHYVGQFSLDT